MVDKFCALCGQSLPDRSLKYIVRIEIISDFDDMVSCPEDDPSEEAHAIFKEMDDMDGHELEDDGYQELSIYLCVHCKNRFARELVDEEEDFIPKKNYGHVYH